MIKMSVCLYDQIFSVYLLNNLWSYFCIIYYLFITDLTVPHFNTQTETAGLWF